MVKAISSTAGARRIGGRQRVAGFRFVGRNGAIGGEGVVDAEDERSKPCGARGRKSLKQEFPTRGIDVPVGEKSTILHDIFHGSIPFRSRWICPQSLSSKMRTNSIK